MGSSWTVEKNGLSLSVEAPLSGEAKLRCRLEASTSQEVTVELGMLSRKHQAYPKAEPWLGELPAESTRKKIVVGSESGTDFELELPAWMRPFRGSALEFSVVVVVQSDGTTIRTPLEGLEISKSTELRLKGLPLKKVLRPPPCPWLWSFFSKLGLGWARRWRHLGKIEIAIDAIDEHRFQVSVKGEKLKGEGRVQLRAREFDYSESSLYLYDPIFSAESPLKPTGTGETHANLSLPSAEGAPPWLCFVWGRIQHGIRWELAFEMPSPSGATERLDLPLSISSVYPSGSG